MCSQLKLLYRYDCVLCRVQQALMAHIYLREGGYVIVVVCLSVC